MMSLCMMQYSHFLTNTGFSRGPISSSESEYSSYSEDWGQVRKALESEH